MAGGPVRNNGFALSGMDSVKCVSRFRESCRLMPPVNEQREQEEQHPHGARIEAVQQSQDQAEEGQSQPVEALCPE